MGIYFLFVFESVFILSLPRLLTAKTTMIISNNTRCMGTNLNMVCNDGNGINSHYWLNVIIDDRHVIIDDRFNWHYWLDVIFDDWHVIIDDGINCYYWLVVMI